jgi:hypothetical protein
MRYRKVTELQIRHAVRDPETGRIRRLKKVLYQMQKDYLSKKRKS